MAFLPDTANLSTDQILNQVYDNTDNSLRVDATVTAVIGDVVINSATSSVTIGNPNNGFTLAVQPDGSINVNTLIKSTVDSIAIGNQAGTNFMSVNADGSINTELEGLGTFQTSQYIVNTSAVQITPTPLANRSSIGFKAICSTSQMIFIGNSNGVTSTTGYPMFNGDSLQMDLTGAQQVWAVASAAGQVLAAIELG